MMEAERILVIEKDEALAVREAEALEEAGYEVARANDAFDGLKKLHEAYPDLIILAMELPVADGEDSFVRIRQASYLPIIVLGGEEELADTLELGADAYLIKPPSLSELVARVRSLLRRKARYEPPGDKAEVDVENHVDSGGNGAKRLTPTEFRLASCLVLNEGKLLEYSQLMSEVWGGKEVSRYTLHFYIHRLQQKLQAYFPYRISIRNFRGVGYCLSGEVSAPE